ncbi:hypothetical protein ACH5RR_030677 [Cinchona calisaya]|uniref:Uncharacterized protein n=1 Tax=Cinchona calisaya TaxID=153742 RepID=A0ABD2YWI7_9GENT
MGEMKNLQISHKEELRATEKMSKDAAIFDCLDSQDYQDRLEKHLVEYHASPEFEELIEDRSMGYFDMDYDQALSYVKKKYLNLDTEDLLQGLVLSTPLQPNSSEVPPENGAA